jgi:molybdate transport system substrate-binding protein
MATCNSAAGCRITRTLAALGLCASLLVAPAARAGAETELHVFAAASLSDAFGEIASDFERAHAGVRVQLNLAGSQQLAAQIEQGAAADVFASADTRWIDYLDQRSLLQGRALVFARNRLVVIVPRANPARISRLQDLARSGVKLVLAADAVPAGKYSREALDRMAQSPGFDPGFARAVLANVVSEEENVKGVVSKVQLGEADAGMCYRSDVTSQAARAVKVLAIPDTVNVLATYPIAVLRGAQQGDLAREFVTLVTSARGQHALQRHNLIPAAASSP